MRRGVRVVRVCVCVGRIYSEGPMDEFRISDPARRDLIVDTSA